jgi:hypothetical protein
MTARRGSLGFKIVRLTRVRNSSAKQRSKHLRSARAAAIAAGRGLVVVAALFISLTIGSQVWRVATRNIALHKQIAKDEDSNREIGRASLRERVY